MTLKLLHKEYSVRSKENKDTPYAYSSYCEHHQSYVGNIKL